MGRICLIDTHSHIDTLMISTVWPCGNPFLHVYHKDILINEVYSFIHSRGRWWSNMANGAVELISRLLQADEGARASLLSQTR